MHYFLYPTKDTTISNDPSYMFKNMGLDEILEVEKRISVNSCSSTSTFPILISYTSSSIELLSGSMSASYASGSTDSSIVSSSYRLVSGAVTAGSVLSRALLNFDLTEISKSIASNDAYRPVNPKFYLNLKVCESKEVPVEYTLAAYPVSQSWEMGTGYKYDGQAHSDGANWKFSDGYSKPWYSGSLTDCSGGGAWWIESGSIAYGVGYADPPYVTASAYYEDCHIAPYVPPVPSPIPHVTGSYTCYQNFDYQTSDVRMDVTTIVNAWLTGEIRNNGLILMHSDESSSIDYGKLRFFSKETNTVYSPCIDMAWEDATITTGSADPIQIRDAVVNMKNMSKQYKFGSILRMDVSARKRYPVKTFTNKFSDYLAPYYLPTGSFYSIKDAESEETVMPYDKYTRLSFDGNGNYFMLDTTCLPQERYFKVEIRSEQSGSIVTFTVPTAFKISR
jgi:hypothetical protein